jgi:hypothetical protein
LKLSPTFLWPLECTFFSNLSFSSTLSVRRKGKIEKCVFDGVQKKLVFGLVKKPWTPRSKHSFFFLKPSVFSHKKQTFLEQKKPLGDISLFFENLKGYFFRFLPFHNFLKKKKLSLYTFLFCI